MNFEYDLQDWSDIERSAQRAGVAPLTPDQRERLTLAANIYLSQSAQREWIKNFVRHYDSNNKIINGLAAQLYDKLIEKDFHILIQEPEYDVLTAALVKLRDDTAQPLSEQLTKLSVRERYYRHILSVWIKLGGELGFSRDGNNRIRGPLVRFFQAVTNPVLGDCAPALETISDIIKREKDRQRSGSSPAGIG